MKTVNAPVAAKGLAFGFSAVNAGQRNATVEPQLIAVSTEGNFRITPQVSKVLGLSHGENIMFLSNVDQIDAAILAKADIVVEFCEEQGLELGSPEALVAIHKAYDSWAVAKGIKEFDTKGNAKTGTERLTKNDKLKYVGQNFDAMLEAALASENEELIDALGRDGITKEETIEILTAGVTPKEVVKFKGSKLANPAGLTGIGTSLTFTDSNVWKQIKHDLGEEGSKVNRVFDIDVEAIQTVTMSNGYEEVEVKALVLGEYTDKEPARIGASSTEEEPEA